MIKGVLLLVTVKEDDAGNQVGIDISTELNKDGGMTMEEALKVVFQHEDTNIRFDLHGETDQEIIEDFQGRLEELKTLAFPDKVNEQGRYVIESIWSGNMMEGGMDYHFVPFEFTPSQEA
jgi:hypothetical protein